MKVFYIVEIEHHENSIFIIKFFQKNHRESNNKYYLLNTLKFLKNKKTNGVRNFRKILRTITNLCLNIYNNNKESCFAFMGAPTIEELKPKKERHKKCQTIQNPDGTIQNSKRYNVYKTFVSNTFSPFDFEHFDIKTSSCYLLKSPHNQKVNKEYTKEFFKNYFENYC